MLVEFSVENFKSIKDKITLSLLASKVKKIKNNHYTVQLANNKSISLLSTAVLYGQNAAGKTNILKAINTMKRIVTFPVQHISRLPYSPFLFDKESRIAPTKFSIIIIIDKVQYEYGFVIDSNKVLAEWLYTDSRTLFTREISNTTGTAYKYDFPSSNLSGHKQLWKDSTRPDALFLSTAVGLNSLQLRPIYDWFSKNLEVMEQAGDKKTTELCISSEDIKIEVEEFLKAADFFITGIKASVQKSDIKKFPIELKSFFEGLALTNKQEVNFIGYDIKIKHPTNYGEEALLDISDESMGTQKMYNLSGYWIEALRENKIIFFDELNNSLHPLIVRYLINRFSSAKDHSKAQLIFTTHDISLLDQRILDRDQIWFCERDQFQSTQLKSLIEYKKSRSDVYSIEKAYLNGRYNAIPIINE